MKSGNRVGTPPLHWALASASSFLPPPSTRTASALLFCSLWARTFSRPLRVIPELSVPGDLKTCQELKSQVPSKRLQGENSCFHSLLFWPLGQGPSSPTPGLLPGAGRWAGSPAAPLTYDLRPSDPDHWTLSQPLAWQPGGGLGWPPRGASVALQQGGPCSNSQHSEVLALPGKRGAPQALRAQGSAEPHLRASTQTSPPRFRVSGLLGRGLAATAQRRPSGHRAWSRVLPSFSAAAQPSVLPQKEVGSLFRTKRP